MEVAMILHVPKQYTYYLSTKRKTNSKARILCSCFHKNIYFVYLIKQKSKAAINTYQNNKTSQLSKNISAIDQITAEILQAGPHFPMQSIKHEATMSHTLKPYYKESLFSDRRSN
jgi:hypothetical protein